MIDPTKPAHIDPEAIYDDGTLVLILGLTHAALSQARKSGGLLFSRSGRKILYRGHWVIDWLESNAQATASGAGHE